MAAEGSSGPPPGLAPPEPEVGPDGEIIGGPRTPQQMAAQKRMQVTKAQVDEVVDIMKTNYEKVLERDVKLSELDDRADALQYGASQFEQQAKSLKNKFWLQNLKMMIIMGLIGLVIIGLLYVRYSGTPSVSSITGSVGGMVAAAPVNETAVAAQAKHCKSSSSSSSFLYLMREPLETITRCVSPKWTKPQGGLCQPSTGVCGYNDPQGAYNLSSIVTLP